MIWRSEVAKHVNVDRYQQTYQKDRAASSLPDRYIAVVITSPPSPCHWCKAQPNCVTRSEGARLMSADRYQQIYQKDRVVSSLPDRYHAAIITSPPPPYHWCKAWPNCIARSESARHVNADKYQQIYQKDRAVSLLPDRYHMVVITSPPLPCHWCKAQPNCIARSEGARHANADKYQQIHQEDRVAPLLPDSYCAAVITSPPPPHHWCKVSLLTGHCTTVEVGKTCLSWKMRHTMSIIEPSMYWFHHFRRLFTSSCSSGSSNRLRIKL